MSVRFPGNVRVTLCGSGFYPVPSGPAWIFPIIFLLAMGEGALEKISARHESGIFAYGICCGGILAAAGVAHRASLFCVIRYLPSGNACGACAKRALREKKDKES